MGSTPTPYQKSFASASILPTCGEIESSARLAVCADWFGVASSLGLAPGRRNAKGWVSLLCPECGRGGACDLDLKAGGWKCFKCSGKGHLGALVGQGAARFERAEPEPERAELSRLDVGAALRALGGIQRRFVSQLISWAKGRGWPEELAARVAELRGLMFCPEDLPRGVPSWLAWACWPGKQKNKSTHARGPRKGAGGDGGADLRGTLEPRGAALPLLLALYNERDRAVSASRRPMVRGAGAKALTLPTAVAGELGAAGFGELGAAVAAAGRGERVYLCEGGPDWAALGALCLLEGRGAAVGARDAGSFVARARALGGALERAGLRGRVRLVLCPHRGDKGDKGEQAAAAAAAVLARVGTVEVARVPAQWLDGEGRGDVSDVLERGGLEALRSYLREAVRWEDGTLPQEQARARLVDLVAECVQQGGAHTVAANLGHGKSYAAQSAALHYAAQGGGAGPRIVLYAAPTLGLAREVARELAKLGGGVRVEVWEGRHDGNCMHSELAAAMAAAVPGGAAEVCAGCPLREPGPEQCGFKRQEARLRLRPGERGLVIVTTHARLVGYDLLNPKGELSRSQLPFEPSVVVVDEDAAGSVLSSFELNADKLLALDEAGSISTNAETLQLLHRLISSGRSFPLAPWAHKLGPLRARDLSAYGRGVLGSIPTATGDTQRVAALRRDLVSWQVPAALEAASRAAWVGAYVHKGKLFLPWDALLPRGKHATLYLDATGDHAAAKAVLGPDAGWHDLRVKAPASARFVRINGVSSSKSDLHGGNGKPRSVRALAGWLASHLAYDGPDTLHVTHKATAPLLRSVVAGSVIHFEGSEARGSNAYATCSRVVLDQWHVPAVALEALTARLQARGADEDEARASARRRLALAPVEQAGGRIRYFDQSRPCEVVFLGSANEFEVDAERECSALLLDLGDDAKARVRACLGSVLGLDHDRAGEVLAPFGEAAALEILRLIVAEREVWAPALESAFEPDGDGVESSSGETCSIYTLQRSSLLLSVPMVTGSVGVSWLSECIKGLGGWEVAARRLGLGVSRLDVGKGAPVCVLHRGPLTRAAVVAALTGRVERVTFDGGSIFLGAGGSRLRLAVAVLVERGEAVTAAAVAGVAGVSVQSARAWARREPEYWSSVAAGPSACELVVLDVEDANKEPARTHAIRGQGEARGQDCPPNLQGAAAGPPTGAELVEAAREPSSSSSSASGLEDANKEPARTHAIRGQGEARGQDCPPNLQGAAAGPSTGAELVEAAREPSFWVEVDAWMDAHGLRWAFDEGGVVHVLGGVDGPARLTEPERAELSRLCA